MQNTPAPYPKGTRFGPLARPEWPPDYDPDDEEDLMLARAAREVTAERKKNQQ